MEREIDTDANNDVIGGPACGEKGKRVLSIQGRGRGNVNSNDTSTSHMTATTTTSTVICSKQKSGDGYDSPSKEEQDMKDLSNFKRIITSCEILQPNPPRCNAGNCDLMACCIYICTKDTKSVKHLCLDHQQEIFGGWPTRSELKLGQFDLSMGMMFGNEWNPIQMAHPHRHPTVIGSTINHAAVAGVGGNEETPEARSSNDNEDDEGSVGAAGGNGESMPTISGMTPLVFAPAGMHTNNQMIARAPVGATLAAMEAFIIKD